MTRWSKRLQRPKELDPRDCRDRVETHFSAEVMVAGYERVYHEALTSGAEVDRHSERKGIANSHERSSIKRVHGLAPARAATRKTAPVN